MERDDDEPAAGPQDALGGAERAGEFGKLLIDGDPERLKRPRRGMDRIAAAPADDALHQLGEFFGPR